MTRQKSRFKRIINGALIALVTLSSIGLGTFNFQVKTAKAENWANLSFLGLNSMPVMLTSTTTPKAAASFELYDTTASYLQSMVVKVRKVDATNPFIATTALKPPVTASQHSGISLWRDDDGDGIFSTTSDTISSSAITGWTTIDSQTWSATFSTINWPVSTNPLNRTRLFLVFEANVMNTFDNPYVFNIQLDVDAMHFSGGTIGNWPDSIESRGPIVIGPLGSGGYGSPLVISEARPGGEEFVEIYNRSTETVSLNEWNIKSGDASIIDLNNLTTKANLPNTTIAPGQFYLIANTTIAPSYDTFLTGSSLNDSAGFIGLYSSTTLMDLLAYGNVSTEALAEGDQAALFTLSGTASLERKAFSDSGPSSMGLGGNHYLAGNSYDSNNNEMDFFYKLDAEPQNSSSEPEYANYNNGILIPHVLINEIRHTAPTLSERWFELFNPTGSTVVLEGYYLQHKAWSHTIGTLSIPAGAYTIVHWNQSGPSDSDDYYTGYIGQDLDPSGGDLSLRASNNIDILDYVQYGGAGYHSEDMAVAQTEWIDNEYVPTCLSNQSLGRKSIDGEDYNSKNDWQTFSLPTPGAPNFGSDSVAPAPVSSLVFTDNDPYLYGLDGNDIEVTWTPSQTSDPSFARYEIFLLPATATIDFNIHKPIISLYQQYQATPSTFLWRGSSAIIKDSAFNLLVENSYRVYVIAFDASGNKSTAATALSNLIFESGGADTVKPNLFHSGVWQATTGQDLHLIVRANDDRAMDPISPLTISYKVGSDFSFDLGSGATNIICNNLFDDWYDCTINNGAWDETKVIGYYITARDDSDNLRYLSASSDANAGIAESMAAQSPFYIDINTPIHDSDSDPDLSGYVFRYDGFPLDGSTVFLEGLALAPLECDSNGFFTYPDNSLNGGSYMLRAAKSGYLSISRSAYHGEQAANLNLYEGSSYYNSTNLSSNPTIKWTAPSDNMIGAPRSLYCSDGCSASGFSGTPILISFDRPMDPASINDQNTSDSGSNIYLTSNGYDRITGQIYYDSSSQQARFFSPTANTLALGESYDLVVTQGVKDLSGNPIVGSNSDGSWSSSFSTVRDTIVDYSDFGSGGVMMPPFVVSTTPAPGSLGQARNSSLLIQFSEVMDPTKINSNTIQLYPVINTSNWTLGAAVAATVSLDVSTRKIATLNPSTNLNSSYPWWVIKVKGSARSLNGMYMSDPASVGGCADYNLCSELNAITAYESNFQINSTLSDLSAPTINGTYPHNYDGISTNSTAVKVGIGALIVSFSEPISPATVNAYSLKLLSGSNYIGAKVLYDPASMSAELTPYYALLPNTQYSLTIAGIRDLADNALAATSTIYFKTGEADTEAPRLVYANGNDYSVAITFSEAMNAAKETQSGWSYSVLNPSNYYVNGLTPQSCANPGAWSCEAILNAPYNTDNGYNLASSSLSLSYDENSRTVTIKGFSFNNTSSHFQIFVDNVRDLSNNLIADNGNRATDVSHNNAARAPLYESSDTSTALAPNESTLNLDMAAMGIMKAGAFPKNNLAGQRSNYIINIPTNRSLPIGGKITLSFPAGFDVSNASKDPYAAINDDINEWNSGKVTISALTADQNSRSITITIGNSPTQSSDYLRLELRGIVNSLIPKAYGSGGYTIDIKTLSSDNGLLEAINSMPFYINSSGARSISGDIHGISAGHIGSMKIFLSSPVTGPMEAEVAINGNGDASADGHYSFINLPDGEYYLYNNPRIDIGGNGYLGRSAPEPIRISGSDAIADLNLSPEAASGAVVNVSLTGNFSTAGVADDVDVYASSPTGFRVKTLYDVGSVSGLNAQLYLPAGDWKIGIRRSLSESAISTRQTMPDWMQPANLSYASDGSTIGNVSFDISGQSSYTISGTVIDGNGFAIANADVWAYQPQGGQGQAFTRSSTNGSFLLKVPRIGNYTLNASKPGLPQGKEMSLNVSGNASGLFLRLSKPAYTISGRILDNNQQPIAFAPVWTWQTNGSGYAKAMSDSTGNYILFVDPGSWQVECDTPSIGRQSFPRTLNISDSSLANINIAPDATVSKYQISGKIGIDSDGVYSSLETPLANIPLRARKFDANGVYLGEDYNTSTDSAGNYFLNVSAGSYRLEIWTKDYGELTINNQDNDNSLNEIGVDDDYSNNPADIDATSGHVSNADIIIPLNDQKLVSFDFANALAGQDGYLRIEKIAASGESLGVKSFLALNDLSLPNNRSLAAGSYHFSVDVPGVGTLEADQNELNPVSGLVDISQATTVNFSLPDDSSDMVTISGKVYSSSIQGGNELREAWVWVINQDNNYRNGFLSNSDGTYSLKVPMGSSYRLSAEKPGFVPGENQIFVATGDLTQNLILLPYTRTIRGNVFTDQDSDNSYDIGEGLARSQVQAQSTGCLDSSAATVCRKVNAPVDANGSYELKVITDNWRISAAADGYLEKNYASDISVFPATGINIGLEIDSEWTNKNKMKQITPSSGGSFDDTAPDSTGVSLVIPPYALGDSSLAASISANKTAALAETSSALPLGSGVKLSIEDNEGQAISLLEDYVDLEMVLYKADIETALAAANTSTSSLKSTDNAYWDQTVNDWVRLATVRTVYYKADAADTDWTLYTDTASSAPAFESFLNKLENGNIDPYDYKLVYSSKTDHFTVFAVIVPFFVSPAQAEPEEEDAPSSSGGGGGGSFSSYCSSVTYTAWGACQSDNFQYREVLSKVPAGCRLKSDQEAAKKMPCVYSPALPAPTPPVAPAPSPAPAAKTIDELYLEQAAFIVRADVNEITSVMKKTRDHAAEQAARDTLSKKMTVDLASLPQTQQNALTNFIAYGSPDTAKAGAGERAGVINSFRSAFGRLPNSVEDWSDVIKIANGRWPKQSNKAVEKKAAESFKKVYLRYPNRLEAHDDAATVVIAYGLRPALRNANSEKNAINTFKAVFKYQPQSATDWDIVRAIAYSGATRDQDTDKDGLSDKHEAAIKTDPKRADTDGDGYSDGIEVLNAYDPLRK
jgi:hypothetical protein